MSLGTDRVRLQFNPSSDNLVDQVKRLSADLIDLCEEHKSLDPRLAALAQTHYEDAAMWARQACNNRKINAYTR